MADQRPPPRPITRLLIANRGEIATRILQTARELAIETYTLHTEADTSHTFNASHSIALSSPAHYLSIPKLVEIAKEHRIDAVHPGYGFLSESAEFAHKMWAEAGAMVVGPGWGILARTGDKLQARRLAQEFDVPTLMATLKPTGSVEGIESFVEQVGLPVMLKAVDGGGGRGIRLVREAKDLANLAKRAIEESPSKEVFAEKAAIEGFRHIEVQIIGDGTGKVEHLWERECSIQRRYQKVVELAPSTIKDREFASRIIKSAIRMAEGIKYFSLGTFEFLANPSMGEFFFLEVNPRLQVEHTITESISSVDIVRVQLEIAQGATLEECSLGCRDRDAGVPPPLHSIQLRLTAEDVQNDWSMSVGKINMFHWPSGNGIRVDTALVSGHEAVVSAEFDSLIAKIIITAGSWATAVQKARRALLDVRVSGIKTNLDILLGIVESKEFGMGECDTTFLEANVQNVLESGARILSTNDNSFFASSNTSDGSGGVAKGLSSSTVLFRKGDAWSIKMIPDSSNSDPRSSAIQHHIKLGKVFRNEFPSILLAEIEYTAPQTTAAQMCRIEVNATSASSQSLMAEGKHRRGNLSDPFHVVIPFPGKLVEVLVDLGDIVQTGDVVCVVQQMKMELEVRARRSGKVKWITEAEDGEDVAEGILVAELEDGGDFALQDRPKL